ncbi:hypothetical protein CBS63078_2398 [Aspergillus niger]|nr:hypothetical protein CBS63078_2398 [Aspergillus niger]KAI3033343.1 hypothetical protein CBS147345_907 [Aspergillus niger]
MGVLLPLQTYGIASRCIIIPRHTAKKLTVDTAPSISSRTKKYRKRGTMSNNQQPQSPRHWHGTVGDRYEHHNVWVRGGPPEPYRRPSIPTTTAATATSDRRGSDSSDMSSNSANLSNSPPSIGDRRRSTGHGASSLFESLTSQKRNSTDQTLNTRRESWNEQGQQGGFFAKWWDGYTRGGSK